MTVQEIFPAPGRVVLIVGDSADEHRVELEPAEARTLAGRLVAVADRAEQLAELQAVIRAEPETARNGPRGGYHRRKVSGAEGAGESSTAGNVTRVAGENGEAGE